MTDSDVLIVGASAAGLGVLESLRRGGYDGRVTMLGAEAHVPYDRPPLSKQVLAGAWTPEQAHLRSAEAFEALGAEFVLGESATSLDVARRTVQTDRRSYSAEHIVIATGTRPRRLPGQPDLRGLHVLRTLDDAVALRIELLAAARLVVVGEGVLGSEISATARHLGLDVTMTGPQPLPMLAQLGPLASARLAGLHSEAGVTMRLGETVTGFEAQAGRVTGVRLASDEVLPADIVVVAIGAVPETAWLSGSELELGDGVICDAHCRAAEGVYAVGDVARWHHEGLGRSVRLENRTNAAEQSAIVAEQILGMPRCYTPTSYFWTDQYTTKIQVFGIITPDAEATVVEGDAAGGRFVASYRRDGVVSAVLGWNMPKQARLHGQEIETMRKHDGVSVL